MVQAVENLTALVVRVIDVGTHPRLTDWNELTVQIVSATPVEGRADLLSRRVGERLSIAVRRDLVPDLQPGSVVSCRARLHLGDVMAEAHPDPADFSIEPPENTH